MSHKSRSDPASRLGAGLGLWPMMEQALQATAYGDCHGAAAPTEAGAQPAMVAETRPAVQTMVGGGPPTEWRVREVRPAD